MNKKILFYTSNGVGLGHLRRTSLIAEAIKKLVPKSEIFFVTMCSKVVFLGILDIPYIKIAPLTDKILVEENYQEFKKTKIKNEAALTKIINDFKPDVIVCDIHCFVNFSFPQSMILPEFNKIKKVLIFRKGDKKSFSNLLTSYNNQPEYYKKIEPILKENFKLEILPLKIFSKIDKINLFDKVIFPHTKETIKQRLSEKVKNKIARDNRFVFSGPIFNTVDKEKVEHCRKKYGFNKRDFNITIILGGGGELVLGNCEPAVDLAIIFLQNFKKIKKLLPHARAVIITGPLFRYNFLLKKLVKEYSGNVWLFNYEDNLIELMSLSKLIISPVGYNAGNEIIQAKTPALLVPLVRGNQQEQHERATRLAAMGIARVICDLNNKTFYKEFNQCVKDLPKMNLMFKKIIQQENGNIKAAQEILSSK